MPQAFQCPTEKKFNTIQIDYEFQYMITEKNGC